LPLLDLPTFSQPATSAQFALKGNWESAWSYDMAAPPTREELLRYLGDASEVAFEAFFGHAFLGARAVGTANDVTHFAMSCITSLAQTRSARDFFEHLQQHLGVTELGKYIAFAEIGAVNAWKSIGPFRLPALDPSLVAINQWWRELECTALAADTTHLKAIEFVGFRPVHHWLAVPVSKPSMPFAASQDAVHHALVNARPRGL
jgi:hypothetical protein